MRDRKKEATTRQTGDDFLFVDPLAVEWPLELYLGKWHQRFEQQPDDWKAAPGTWCGFGWEGVDAHEIINSSLPDEDFIMAVKVADAEFITGKGIRTKEVA